MQKYKGYYNYISSKLVIFGILFALVFSISGNAFAEGKSFEETFKHIKDKHKLYPVTSNRPLFFGNNLTAEQLKELEGAFGKIDKEHKQYLPDTKRKRFASPREGILDPKGGNLKLTKPAARGISVEESIPFFFSKIEVLGNGKVLITETIIIINEGKAFTNGITRRFKKKFTNHLGEKQHVTYAISSIKRNSKAETYYIDKTNDEIILEIGAKNHILPDGVHSYTITYIVDRLISYHGDQDWLYYNVTGTDMPLPLIRAAATVILPKGLIATEQTGFTGVPGYEGQDIDLHIDGEGSRGFVVNRTLDQGEGFSLAITWPGGYIEAPDSDRKIAFFLLDHGSLLAGLFGLLAIGIYLVVTWKIASKTAKSSRISPISTPPNELSPATIRQLVLGKKLDNKALTSTLLNMAVKGVITITQDENKQFTIIKNKDDATDLSHGERKVLRHLFTKADTSIEINDANNLKIRRASKDLKQSLAAEYRRIFFSQNIGYVLTCLLMFIITILSMTMMSLSPIDIIKPTILLCISIPLVFAFIAEAYTSKQEHKKKPAIVYATLAITSIATSFYFLHIYSVHTSIATALIIPIIAICASIAMNLFMSPKILGGEIMQSLKGFRLYFIGNSVPTATTGDKAMHLFGKLLPYAFAMDTEKDWHKKFAEHFKQHKEYTPKWYKGGTFTTNVEEDITHILSTDFAKALNMQVQAPKKNIRSRSRKKINKSAGNN